ncbi:EAL domain-containing protein [Hydrogenothermus marinus]|uniref:Diguanylate cyclase (GGDEF)-like protein n=1 Tax=Hydrogenothermus marinus TaxID=133270 RepID=A0A3M0BIT2_9AQUI|nr:GGDEF domain-containing protein [Hydrogenothermus marinus]RMA97300.1 diguanylate cyclase (GGDEF)-like protein [Hydrogenothermus marinus]
MKKIFLILEVILLFSLLVLLFLSFNTVNELEISYSKETISILREYIYFAGGILALVIFGNIYIFYTAIKSNSKKEFLEKNTGFLTKNNLNKDLKNLKNIKAILILEIENLLEIENTYGTEVVETILFQLNVKLKKILPSDSRLIRYSWSEVLILIPEVEDIFISDILENLEKVIKVARFSYKNITLKLNIFIGVNKDVQKTKNLDEAIKDAFFALEDAKKNNKIISIYGKDKANLLPKLIEIKESIDKDRINLLFQPIVDVKNKKIFKYEVLSRILNSKGEVIRPDIFLEIIKGTTINTEFNLKILEKSIQLLKKYEKLELSVNVSPSDILHGYVVKYIRNINDSSVLNRLTLEVLESEEIYDYQLFKENLDYIKYAGCKIAIDDFGSGYSNLMHILEINPDYIKIDGSIIKNILKDRKAYILVKTIKDFAEDTDIKVVAEYVSNKEIFEVLNKLNIQYMQGYFFGKPENIPKNPFIKKQTYKDKKPPATPQDWIELIKWRGEDD